MWLMIEDTFTLPVQVAPLVTNIKDEGKHSRKYFVGAIKVPIPDFVDRFPAVGHAGVNGCPEMFGVIGARKAVVLGG